MVHITVKSVPLGFVSCNYLTVTAIQIFILELHSNVCDYTIVCPNLKNYSVTHEKIIIIAFYDCSIRVIYCSMTALIVSGLSICAYNL